ncbi:hypothetical protein SADUNF_Sadunf13G0113600 [Salix dunnii]|uniref:Uncharacterized protein n=1 Tax=Salix dunnii TaxID=1413687 RepID=A0A835MMA6_9ROSI|nr:hypothetical protein SADUNF_Sadunf13G0113600 [Salix dunnii]
MDVVLLFNSYLVGYLEMKLMTTPIVLPENRVSAPLHLNKLDCIITGNLSNTFKKFVLKTKVTEDCRICKLYGSEI